MSVERKAVLPEDSFQDLGEEPFLTCICLILNHLHFWYLQQFVRESSVRLQQILPLHRYALTLRKERHSYLLLTDWYRISYSDWYHRLARVRMWLYFCADQWAWVPWSVCGGTCWAEVLQSQEGIQRCQPLACSNCSSFSTADSEPSLASAHSSTSPQFPSIQKFASYSCFTSHVPLSPNHKNDTAKSLSRAKPLS